MKNSVLNLLALSTLSMLLSACSGYKVALNEPHLSLTEAELPTIYTVIDNDTQSKTFGQTRGSLTFSEPSSQLIAADLTATAGGQSSRFLGRLLNLNGGSYFEMACMPSDPTSTQCQPNPDGYTLVEIQLTAAKDYIFSVMQLKNTSTDPDVTKLADGSFLLDNSKLSTSDVLSRMKAYPLQAIFRAP